MHPAGSLYVAWVCNFPLGLPTQVLPSIYTWYMQKPHEEFMIVNLRLGGYNDNTYGVVSQLVRQSDSNAIREEISGSRPFKSGSPQVFLARGRYAPAKRRSLFYRDGNFTTFMGICETNALDCILTGW